MRTCSRSIFFSFFLIKSIHTNSKFWKNVGVHVRVQKMVCGFVRCTLSKCVQCACGYITLVQPQSLKFESTLGIILKIVGFLLFESFHRTNFKRLPKNVTFTPVRVAMFGMNHNKVLTQWRHMLISQFRTNIFLMQITSTYFWASEVFKNQSFKSQLFSSSLKKNASNWNLGLTLMLLLCFINKIQNLYQFSGKKS